MTTKKKKFDEISVLFEERVGVCSISMCLDKRHPKREKDEAFPLCVRFTIQRTRYYHSLGEKCSSSQLAKVATSTGQGERKLGIETNYERQNRLLDVFNSFVNTVVGLNQTGPLTLDRIKTALTGRCEATSFISVWEEIIAEKRNAGKAGTADSYEGVLNSFKELTGFDYKDGFAIDSSLINKWVEGMVGRNLASATQGIYLRTCRLVVNRCIGEGYLMPKAYMFGKSRDKVKIPRSKDNPKNTVKTEANIELIYKALGMFLMQYFCCGCNLADLALLRYNRFYFDTNGDAFQFIRKKSEDETMDGEGMEVIVPIIDPMRELLEAYGADPKLDALVFPFLLGDAIKMDEQAMRDRVHQENKNIAKRLKKFTEQIEWTVHPTGTFARHSFATNLHAAKVPREYISDAMGHSLGNKGQITMRYISPYTVKERMTYNNLLMGIVEDPNPTAKIVKVKTVKQSLLDKMENFSEEEIRDALIMMKKRETGELDGSLEPYILGLFLTCSNWYKNCDFEDFGVI